MPVEFIKICAQGNDYIYIDRRQNILDVNIKDFVIRLSDRHFGVGSDGVVFLDNCDQADVRMEMYNADGSRGRMCGSALRSVVYLQSKIESKTEYRVLTDSGIRKGWLENGLDLVKVEMGKVLQYEEIVDDVSSLFWVDVGNLHVVKIVDELSEIDLMAEVHKQERELDEQAINREFVEISGASRVTMKVYELGSGFTLACGTGAVASAYTCRQEGMVNGDEITVIMPGGEVKVTIGKEEIYLTGNVQEVFRGSIEK
jgi:diaminopimelate epimerase